VKPHDRLASSGNSVSRGVDMVTEYENEGALMSC